MWLPFSPLFPPSPLKMARWRQLLDLHKLETWDATEFPSWRPVDSKSTTDMLKDISLWKSRFETNKQRIAATESAARFLTFFIGVQTIDFVFETNLTEGVGTQTFGETKEVLDAVQKRMANTHQSEQQHGASNRREAQETEQLYKAFCELQKQIKENRDDIGNTTDAGTLATPSVSSCAPPHATAALSVASTSSSTSSSSFSSSSSSAASSSSSPSSEGKFADHDHHASFSSPSSEGKVADHDHHAGATSLDNLNHLHDVLMKGITKSPRDAGNLRDIDVCGFRGGGELFAYAKPEEVPMLFDLFLDYYHEALFHSIRSSSDLSGLFKLAAWSMAFFLTIHPYVDGNGRMSRLLVAAVLHSCAPFPVAVGNRDAFLSSVIACQSPKAGASAIAANHQFAPPSDLCALLIESAWKQWRNLWTNLAPSLVRTIRYKTSDDLTAFCTANHLSQTSQEYVRGELKRFQDSESSETFLGLEVTLDTGEETQLLITRIGNHRDPRRHAQR